LLLLLLPLPLPLHHAYEHCPPHRLLRGEPVHLPLFKPPQSLCICQQHFQLLVDQC
jgi:hypothetical protein